jgi:NAD(P)-dependent dehydrogenase (short-subunit alcohol dehydrogenase family)
MKTAEATLAGILEPGRVSLVQMDSTSFESIKNAAKTVLEASKNKINILVANAGIMDVPEQILTDGHEVHFQTNHLSHCLLFPLLKPSLLGSSTPIFHSRIVLVSSSSYRTSTLFDSDNCDSEKDIMTCY